VVWRLDCTKCVTVLVWLGIVPTLVPNDRVVWPDVVSVTLAWLLINRGRVGYTAGVNIVAVTVFSSNQVAVNPDNILST
jgi:hypothetical protein